MTNKDNIRTTPMIARPRQTGQWESSSDKLSEPNTVRQVPDRPRLENEAYRLDAPTRTCLVPERAYRPHGGESVLRSKNTA